MPAFLKLFYLDYHWRRSSSAGRRAYNAAAGEIYRDLFHNMNDKLLLDRISIQQQQLDESKQERLNNDKLFYRSRINEREL